MSAPTEIQANEIKELIRLVEQQRARIAELERYLKYLDGSVGSYRELVADLETALTEANRDRGYHQGFEDGYCKGFEDGYCAPSDAPQGPDDSSGMSSPPEAPTATEEGA